MVYIFIILLIVILIQFFIVCLFFSNLVLNIEECDISYNENSIPKFFVKKLKVNVQLYLFKVIRILNIKIHRNYCEIFKIKIKFDTLKKLKDDTDTSFEFIIRNIKKMKPQIDKIDLNMFVGTEEPMVTTFSIPIISMILSILISKSMKKYNKNNCFFKVTPNYINTNNFWIRGSSRLSFNTLRVIFFIKKHNEIKA